MHKHLAFIAAALFSGAAYAQDVGHNPQPYADWLAAFKADASAAGISAKTLEDAFANSQAPIEQVIDLDRKQPEGRVSLPKYLKNTVTETRIQQGKELLQEHAEVLAKVSKKYGVPQQFIVALWGIETNFGENTGNFSVVDALATLAYDGRRSDYFRKELINALKIADADHIPVDNMYGSWAGAMGQCQFMPTSFLDYAVDFDGDGQRDIWDNTGDVFASIANYLASSGWKTDEPWGSDVILPDGFDLSLADINQTRAFGQWQTLGVRPRESMNDDAVTSLIFAGEGEFARPFIITDNYKVILKWNRSRLFATAVVTLADKLKAD